MQAVSVCQVRCTTDSNVPTVLLKLSCLYPYTASQFNIKQYNYKKGNSSCFYTKVVVSYCMAWLIAPGTVTCFVRAVRFHMVGVRYSAIMINTEFTRDVITESDTIFNRWSLCLFDRDSKCDINDSLSFNDIRLSNVIKSCFRTFTSMKHKQNSFRPKRNWRSVWTNVTESHWIRTHLKQITHNKLVCWYVSKLVYVVIFICDDTNNFLLSENVTKNAQCVVVCTAFIWLINWTVVSFSLSASLASSSFYPT
jgi:hypothetical protein